MQPTFNTNHTKALCNYIASNTIAFGTSTKPATAEKTAHQITSKISASSTKEFSKRDHQSTAHASDQSNDHGVDTCPKTGVCSMTGGKHQYKQRSLEDTNRNKASQDHRNRWILPHRRDTFTLANDLAVDLVGLPLHDGSIKIQATMETSVLNCNNRQDDILQVNSLGLADYQHKQEVQKLSRSIRSSSEADHLLPPLWQKDHLLQGILFLKPPGNEIPMQLQIQWT